MMAAGTPPDAIFIGDNVVRQYVVLDSVLPLNEYIAKDASFNKKDYYPAAIKPYVINDKVYGLPNDVAVWAIVYNKDIFDQADVPYPKANWTWQDFLRTARKVNKKNDQGVHEIFGCIFGNYNLWMWQNKGDFSPLLPLAGG